MVLTRLELCAMAMQGLQDARSPLITFDARGSSRLRTKYDGYRRGMPGIFIAQRCTGGTCFSSPGCSSPQLSATGAKHNAPCSFSVQASAKKCVHECVRLVQHPSCRGLCNSGGQTLGTCALATTCNHCSIVYCRIFNCIIASDSFEQPYLHKAHQTTRDSHPSSLFLHICRPLYLETNLTISSTHSTMQKATSGAVTLSNGVVMPTIGIGTFQASGQALYDCLTAAMVQGGVRHIDTARIYKVRRRVVGGLAQCARLRARTHTAW